MSGMFRVGVVTSTHGVKGAVKVYPTTDDPKRFLDLKKVLFSKTDREEDAARPLSITRVQFFKNQVILTFQEVSSMDEAEILKGGSLWITDEQAVPLEKDEFYIRDFLEAQVQTEDGEKVGVISDIMETGSNFVLEIKEPSGKRFLMPAIHDCILNMDKEAHLVTVRILKGLRE